MMMRISRGGQLTFVETLNNIEGSLESVLLLLEFLVDEDFDDVLAIPQQGVVGFLAKQQTAAEDAAERRFVYLPEPLG